MQTVLSKIWTLMAMPISTDDNHVSPYWQGLEFFLA